MASIDISVPPQAYKVGLNYGPASQGSSKIAAGTATTTVSCGYIKKTSVVRILQNAVSASFTAGLTEAKFDGSGTFLRTTGDDGTFVASTGDGANATNDVTFDWIVLPF